MQLNVLHALKLSETARKRSFDSNATLSYSAKYRTRWNVTRRKAQSAGAILKNTQCLLHKSKWLPMNNTKTELTPRETVNKRIFN
jgi:hypothetical protein